MSSPPPPYGSSLPNPKKRPSLSANPTLQNASKRPKLHPLRQTSFPVQSDVNAAYGSATIASARSETGSVSNSIISAASGDGPVTAGGTKVKIPGRGRGRPRKSTTINEDEMRNLQSRREETGSLIDGSTRNAGAGGRGGTKSVVSARSGGVAGGNVADEDEDEENENDIDGLLGSMDESERKQAEEEESRQEQRRDRLTDTFNSDQYARYSQWRALTLNKATIKKLVNSIVSQSVTQAPLQAVNIYAKWFVGEILERARDVQREFAIAYEKTREDEKTERKQDLRKAEARQQELRESKRKREEASLAAAAAAAAAATNNNTATTPAGDGSEAPTPISNPTPTPRPSSVIVAEETELRSLTTQIARLKKEVDEYIPNPHNGGLLPDHLREALRRYKTDGEDGGTGFEGLSHGLMGVHGSATWRVGDGACARRLFR